MCGTKNQPGERFRGECGKPLADGPKESTQRDPRSYTPKHIAEKILTSRSALEGERKQVTVLFATTRQGENNERAEYPDDRALSTGADVPVYPWLDDAAGNPCGSFSAPVDRGDRAEVVRRSVDVQVGKRREDT
jgi:hypothetical protein